VLVQLKIAHAQEVSAVVAIRAVLIGMSPLLRDTLAQGFSSQTDVEIVGELSAHGWRERLRNLSPDVVIISLRRGESDDITTRLLKIVPNVSIITLSHDNRRAIVTGVRARPTVFLDVSPEQIANLIIRRH
jgi:DNA-binding NarL/FixJ family response regulator